MNENPLVKAQSKEIVLGDGNTYKLSPITLNILAMLEEEFDCELTQLSDKLAKKQASALRTLIFILLKSNHPGMTKEQVGELITIDIMGQVSSSITDIINSVGNIKAAIKEM